MSSSPRKEIDEEYFDEVEKTNEKKRKRRRKKR